MADQLFTLRLRERQLLRMRALHNLEHAFASLLKSKKYETRADIRSEFARMMNEGDPCDLLEFGVFKGDSMRTWVSSVTNADMRFYGFDSFRGLPEDWAGKMIKGTFATGGQLPDIQDERLTFIPGWIQNTLPGFLQTYDSGKKKRIFVHNDVDLYSATLFILSALWFHFDEIVVLYDEFGVDENLAMYDFMSAFPIKFTFHGHAFLGQEKHLPQKVLCTIRKTALVV